MIDKKKVAVFWENHALRSSENGLSGTANLESSEILAKKKIALERDMLSKYIKEDIEGTFIDLGAGYGEWSIYFKDKFRNIIAYEQSQVMCELFSNNIKNNNIHNIKIEMTDVSKIEHFDSFSVVLLSGILIYLQDDDVSKILSKLYKSSAKGSEIILRDATGLDGDHKIDGKFSEALQSNYYAFYRSRDHYISLFREHGFSLKQDEDMFPKNSDLNKWKETRLRVYSFVRNN